MAEVKEGVKIDRLEFTFDIADGAFPTFTESKTPLEDCQEYFRGFGLEVTRGIKPFFYSARIANDVIMLFSDRRITEKKGLPRIPCGKIIVGHTISNTIPVTSVISRVKPLLPKFVQLRRICRVDIASDKFIPFKEFMGNVAPLGIDSSFCASEFSAIYRKGGRPGTYQFGNGDVVVRLYDKQAEQGTDFPWARAEMQFRGDIIRHTGNVPTDASCLDSILQLVSHGLHFFRPCEVFYADHSAESVVSAYWLKLFSQLSGPGRLRRNVYYV